MFHNTKSSMTTVTREELRVILGKIKDPQRVTLISKTVPRMRKKNNPNYGKIFKVSKISGVIGCNYQKEVNQQRNREQKLKYHNGKVDVNKVPYFVPKSRRWGTKVGKTPWIRHKNKHYLEVKVEHAESHTFCDDQNNVVEGEKLSQIKTFFNSSHTVDSQNVSRKIIIRDYHENNIYAITLHDSGRTYLVKSK